MLFDSGSAAHAAHAVVQVIDPATGKPRLGLKACRRLGGAAVCLAASGLHPQHSYAACAVLGWYVSRQSPPCRRGALAVLLPAAWVAWAAPPALAGLARAAPWHCRLSARSPVLHSPLAGSSHSPRLIPATSRSPCTDRPAGEALARYAGFMPAETITSLAVWDPTETLPQQQPQQQPQQPQQAQQAQQGSPARAGAADAGGTAGEGGGEGLRSHPIALSPESPGSTAAAAAAAALEAAPGATAAAAAADEERPWGGFIVVGTSIDQGGGFGSHPKDKWDDESSAVLQGRLLLLQLTTATAASASGAGGSGAPAAASAAEPWEPPRRLRLQLLPVAQLRLPSRVLALCPGSTRLTGSAASAGAAGAGASAGGSREGPAAPRLFASVGRRLVALEWRARQQLLRRVAWTPTNRPLASLQVGSCAWEDQQGRPGATASRGAAGRDLGQMAWTMQCCVNRTGARHHTGTCRALPRSPGRSPAACWQRQTAARAPRCIATTSPRQVEVHGEGSVCLAVAPAPAQGTRRQRRPCFSWPCEGCRPTVVCAGWTAPRFEAG